MKQLKILSVLVTLCAAALAPSLAEAAPKKGPLEGEPVVRKKLQLRRFRFQITPFVGMSLSQPFVHMGYVGARIGTHFADWIGVRAGFGYGVVNLDSKLLRAVNDGGVPTGVEPGQVDGSVANGPVCGDYNNDGTVDAVNGGAPCRELAETDNPAPLLHDFQSGVTRAQWQASVDAVFTPFSGKLGLFSAIFTEYDIYVFGGLGLVGWNKHYKNAESTSETLNLDTSDPSLPSYCQEQGINQQNTECLLHPVSADTGVKVGGSFGAGVHLFLTDWVALNLEIQDIVTSNNLTGLNTTVTDVPPQVNKDDKDVFHNVTMQLGAKFYIPFKAKRTK
jgi:outer membrane beta-barrel protein